LFEEHGPVEHTKVIREKDTGRSKTFGFVTFFDCESAAKAINAKNGFIIGTKRLKVGVARLPTDRIENRKLVVKGLPVFYTEDDAFELFSQFGEVIECRLLRGRTETSRGQCFVSYVAEEECVKGTIGRHHHP
jgi:polyadenylate-binding protein